MFNSFLKRGIEALRQPMADEERLNKIREWNNRNVWNDPTLTYDDTLAIDVPKNRYYGA